MTLIFAPFLTRVRPGSPAPCRIGLMFGFRSVCSPRRYLPMSRPDGRSNPYQAQLLQGTENPIANVWSSNSIVVVTSQRRPDHVRHLWIVLIVILLLWGSGIRLFRSQTSSPATRCRLHRRVWST